MRYILAPLFRVWFYLANFIAIILLFPFIFFTSLSPKTYLQFFYFERLWAKIVLVLCGFRWKVNWAEKPEPNGQYIICANHTSMLDIMLTLAVFPTPYLFIGKKELTKLPLFGYFYKRTNILVDRSSLSSRKLTYDLAAEKIEEGLGMCIYPEGMAPREEITLAPFKNGAFRLAATKGVTIIPAAFHDCKRLLPYDNFRGRPGLLKVDVMPFLRPQENSPEEVSRLKQQCYDDIFQSLQAQK
ncbi:lysophospholipid acyltransferase family protein [Croceimicrobium hydrocarbonivorans]|uniref:1-acyl-sn-glycerol-3-phosphate acyltransferase n=1 Tax=Croceimicrobium hydrocarbonivorans TaxID=2761580 RepID=A0A7H0VJ14_9FLAO|nr:lysophospholipid acyltransferase family protein [Croceimicrobium hydrocarbonivorans]QNR25712.1 1-acyl-sn-glycerol-3-phosphate acyltransferase [Croceimicrobium hydrocarbonivorans]